MRIPSANKAASVPGAGERCHHCNRQVGWPHCRMEPHGWYCVQRGLQLGEGVDLDVPAPVIEPWELEPTVLGAAEAEATALTAFEQADAAWRTAYQRLHQRNPQAERWVMSGAGSEPSRGEEEGRWLLHVGGLRFWRTGTVRALMDAENEAKTRRDEAGEALGAARAAHHDVLQQAQWRHRTQQAA